MPSPPVLFEDDALIAVVKPAGLATANVPPGEPSAFREVRRRLAERRGGEPFLGVVSRLDRPVSGVVVFAKTRAAAAALARQFRDRSVRKTYYALVEGRFPAALGTWVEWEDAVVRPRRGRSRAADADSGEEGQAAVLRARVLRRLGEASLVELEPATGRRHQLRAQLAARGCPIVGDRLYGARLPFAGIALHAAALALDHPTSRRPLTLAADVPAAWHGRFAAALDAVPARPAIDWGDGGPGRAGADAERDDGE
jgi:23S rRNA pseudouridine1911/1915/1917 synthase